jgi:hypothetical protein
MKYLYWNNPKLNRKQLLQFIQKQGMAIIISSLAKKYNYISRNNNRSRYYVRQFFLRQLKLPDFDSFLIFFDSQLVED